MYLGTSLSFQDAAVSGVSWFDPELGLAIEADLNQDITMIMTMPIPVQGRSMPVNMTNVIHQAITIKLESVK